MSADAAMGRMTSALGRLLGKLVAVCADFPRAVLAACLFATLACGALSYFRLGFHSSRGDLLNPRDDYNKIWLDYIQEFGDQDDAVVVVEGVDKQHVAPVLEELAQAIARQPKLFSAVLHGVDLRSIRSKGLHYLSTAELGDVESFLAQSDPILKGDWGRLNLGRQAAGAGQLLAHPEALQDPRLQQAAMQMQGQLPLLVQGLGTALRDDGKYQSPWPEVHGSISTLQNSDAEYLLAGEGRLGFVLLRMAMGEGEFARGSEAVDELRRLLQDVRTRHPEVSVGLTGIPVMENDEMRASEFDMNLSNVISLAAVGLLFYAGFGGLRHSLLGVGALVLGMVWSFGFATEAVGHLNILSVAFGVVLIGIGINFPIHFVSCYLEQWRRCGSSRAALVQAARRVGPGLVTAGVTTSLAFFTTALTDFRGVAELGIISGGGIFLCIAAALIPLPSLITLADRRREAPPAPPTLQVAPWINPIFRFPRAAPGLVAAVSLVAALGLLHLKYDDNLLHLQPRGLESVQWEHKLLAESDQSMWYALSIADSPEQLLARKARFQELPTVERVEEVTSMLPGPDPRKSDIIRRIQRRLASLPESIPAIPVEPPEVLGQALAQLESGLLAGDNQTRGLRQQVADIRQTLRQVSSEDCFRRISQYQQNLAADLLHRLQLLRASANPDPPSLTDLPESLVTRFIGKHHRHLMKVYARGSIWDRDQLEKFVSETQKVDPKITGNPLQAYYASEQMKRSYLHAGVYSVLMVAIVVMIGLRSVRLLLLAMVPLLLGMVQMFGLMGWLGIPLNPANLIALPLIVGIGVDSGVHLAFDYALQTRRYRLTNSTLNSIMLSALTTTGSFGALLFAGHHGLRSLGQTLAIGVTTCFVSAVLFLPPIFVWLSRHRPSEDDEPAPERPATAGAPEMVRRRRRRMADTAVAVAGETPPEIPAGL